MAGTREKKSITLSEITQMQKGKHGMYSLWILAIKDNQVTIYSPVKAR